MPLPFKGTRIVPSFIGQDFGMLPEKFQTKGLHYFSDLSADIWNTHPELVVESTRLVMYKICSNEGLKYLEKKLADIDIVVHADELSSRLQNRLLWVTDASAFKSSAVDIRRLLKLPGFGMRCLLEYLLCIDEQIASNIPAEEIAPYTLGGLVPECLRNWLQEPLPRHLCKGVTILGHVDGSLKGKYTNAEEKELHEILFKAICKHRIVQNLKLPDRVVSLEKIWVGVRAEKALQEEYGTEFNCKDIDFKQLFKHRFGRYSFLELLHGLEHKEAEYASIERELQGLARPASIKYRVWLHRLGLDNKSSAELLHECNCSSAALSSAFVKSTKEVRYRMSNLHKTIQIINSMLPCEVDLVTDRLVREGFVERINLKRLLKTTTALKLCDAKIVKSGGKEFVVNGDITVEVKIRCKSPPKCQITVMFTQEEKDFLSTGASVIGISAFLRLQMNKLGYEGLGGNIRKRCPRSLFRLGITPDLNAKMDELIASGVVRSKQAIVEACVGTHSPRILDECKHTTTGSRATTVD